MSKPKASISVPEEKEQLWDSSIELFLQEAGMKGKPAKLSTLVWGMVLDSKIVDQKGLADLAARENLKSGNRKYIVLSL
jgi:hypothetical protein